MALAVPSVKSHAPDGVEWATYTKWDGVPRDPASFANTTEFFNWICPNAIPRGIREAYYVEPVFADPVNPTMAEVDHWHRRTIRQFRRLVGISEAQVPFQMDQCLAARALWGQEYTAFLL